MNSIESLEKEVLDRAANVIKCLGHPLRIRLLAALEEGEKTVSELQERSEATQATVSQQLATLRGRGIVECRRDGANVFYWITEPRVSQILDCIRHCDQDSVF
jgi:DNA-binding transcriptional ArsR family regulator